MKFVFSGTGDHGRKWQPCRDNVFLSRFPFRLADELLENTHKKNPSKTCSVSISQYAADGSSGNVILALRLCRMTFAFAP